MINRYPFPVPEWCRVIWASPEARATWEPRLTAIGQAWHAAELASVGRFRRVARQTISAAQLPAFSRKAIDAGLVAGILTETGSGGTYQAGAGSTPTGSFHVFLADSPASARAFLRAWEQSDDKVIGDLLGFPSCCGDFFQKVWVDDKRIDTTWDMAGSPEEAGVIDVTPTSLESNILLRWLGVRWVPHLPCSFDCAHTVALGKHFRTLIGPQEAAWMDELLNSPIEWSAFHGIGELKTPILKVSFKTDATAERLAVRFQGTGYPQDGAQGTVFPYKRHVKPRAIPMVLTENPRDWTDNGFTSKEAMEKAHEALAHYFWRHFDRKRAVLDLGCGNGKLVRKISDSPTGLEVELLRAKAARQSGMRCLTGNISDVSAWKDEAKDIVLLMLGRLTEIPNPKEVLEALQGRTVLVYTYGDWDLRECATKLGVHLEFQETHDGVQMGVLS